MNLINRLLPLSVQNSVDCIARHRACSVFLIDAEKRIDTYAELQYLLQFLYAFRINRKTFTFTKSLQ